MYARKSFVFHGAGNSGVAGYAQCWAYNALCVGGYAERSTDGWFADDSVWAGSTYRNKDGVNGREVPPIVGPISASVPNYFGSGYVGVGGTSIATPAVAGLAGLLLTTYPFMVGTRPALMRAVLMAFLSDVNNYEVVEFTAPVGGTYTVRVSAPRWHGCAAEGGRKRARFAAAWTKEPNPPVTAPVAG